MSPSATVFDLDLTLCEHDQDSSDLLARTFERVGVEQFCTPADLAAVTDEIPEAEGDVEFFQFCFEAAAERAGADPTAARELAEAHDDLIDHSAVSFLPGAETAIDVARDAGPVALVTNGSRETQTEKLRALGLVDAFDIAVFCDPTNGIAPKPDPVPFERALSAVDAAPEETLVVGDSLAADVAGANALGMTSVWVPYDDHSGGEDHSPDHALDSLTELPDLL
jgi:putative hydrolase of the HAD superfamily